MGVRREWSFVRLDATEVPDAFRRSCTIVVVPIARTTAPKILLPLSTLNVLVTAIVVVTLD